jgi:hypothetical protein
VGYTAGARHYLVNTDGSSEAVNNLSINRERDLISKAIIRTYKLDYRHFNRIPSREVQLGYRIIALRHNITVAQLKRPANRLAQMLLQHSSKL